MARIKTILDHQYLTHHIFEPCFLYYDIPKNLYKQSGFAIFPFLIYVCSWFFIHYRRFSNHVRRTLTLIRQKFFFQIENQV